MLKKHLLLLASVVVVAFGMFILISVDQNAYAISGSNIVAQATVDSGSPRSTGSSEIDKWLNTIINVLSALVSLVVLISIIIAGIQYMTAGGNASQVAAAKQRISLAILAFVLFLFGYAFLQWIIPGGIF